MTYKNESSIEIAAPPAKVREIVRHGRTWTEVNKETTDNPISQLLNFPAYPEWHTDFIKGVEVQAHNKTAQTLAPGDKVECNVEGFKFMAEIKVRTTQPVSTSILTDRPTFRQIQRTSSRGKVLQSSPLPASIHSAWSPPRRERQPSSHSPRSWMACWHG